MTPPAGVAERAPDRFTLPPSTAALTDGRLWAAVLALLLLLFALFRTFIVREVAWAYPANYDQTKYLDFSYAIYESVLRDGFRAGLGGWIATPYSNGMLIHFNALLLMLAFGGSRLTVLSVNFAALAAYLVTITFVTRRLTGTRRFALLAFGLALGTGAQWFGNLIDYRLDFSSTCLFGIFISLVMRSGIFREGRWAAAAGVAAAVLVANRFLSSLYVAGIYAGMIGYFAVVYPLILKRREPRALRNVVVSALVGAAISTPLVLVSRQAIYDYYVVQQGLEKSVRAAEFAVEGTLRALLYYPRSLVVHHVGLPLVLAAVLALLVAGLTAVRTRGAGRPPSALPWIGDGGVFLGVSFFVTMGVLSANITRSPIVGGIAVPVFTWAVLLAIVWLLRPGDPLIQPRLTRAAAAAAIVALTCTLAAQAMFFGSHFSYWKARADVDEISRLYRDIGAYADRMQWSSGAVAADSIRDYLIGSAMTAVHYENTGRLVSFASALAGGSVMAPPRDVLLAHIARADFLVLTHRRDANEPPYPMVDAMDDVRPEMEKAARSMLPLGEYAIYGRLVHAYARPVVRVISGVSGGWVTSDGLLLEVPARGTASTVELTGAINPWIARDLTATCSTTEGGTARDIPGRFAMVAAEQAYHAGCALPPDADGDGIVRIRLAFSRYFVPRDVGLNEDMRQLVVTAPARMELAAAR